MIRILLATLAISLLSGCPSADSDQLEDQEHHHNWAGPWLEVHNQVELRWDLIVWTERDSGETGEIPTFEGGLLNGSQASAEVSPGDYAISAQEPSGCFASLESTGPLDYLDTYEWSITVWRVDCDGGQ